VKSFGDEKNLSRLRVTESLETFPKAIGESLFHPPRREQVLRPEVAHLEDIGNALERRADPGGNTDGRRRAGGEDQIRAFGAQANPRRQDGEFQPGPESPYDAQLIAIDGIARHHADSVDVLLREEPPPGKPRQPGLVVQPGDHRYAMSHLHEILAHVVAARPARAFVGDEIFVDVDEVHARPQCRAGGALDQIDLPRRT
jgi:hypothetical protein